MLSQWALEPDGLGSNPSSMLPCMPFSPQFSHLQNGNNNVNSMIRLLGFKMGLRAGAGLSHHLVFNQYKCSNVIRHKQCVITVTKVKFTIALN